MLLVSVVTVLVAVRLRRLGTARSTVRTTASQVTDASAQEGNSLRAPVLTGAPARVPEQTARMQHGDAHRTHRAHGHGPVEPKIAWKTPIGGPIQGQVVASADESTLYVASLGGTLTALGRDGHIAWKVDLHGRVYSTPCVGNDGTVYVGSDARTFYAVSPTGTVRWKLDTESDADTGPALAPNGTIVFASGRTVYAVGSAGTIAWRFRAKGKVFTAPAVADDGTIYVGAQDHRAYALAPNGTVRWSVDLGADVDGAPVLGDDGAVYFGTDADEIVRLGRDKGEIVWRARVGGYVRGGLSIGRDGDVLAGVYGPLPRQVRVAAATGKLLGAFEVAGTGARDFGVHGGALEDDDGTLYFGGQDDAAYAVDRSGNLRWRFVTGADVDAPLTLLRDGSLVVPSDDGMVYLLAAPAH
ncbi:PQQ-binding-like beta-propeller repeat protein [Pendulispora brunnea]|uniref:PQQ-binding-like beta-propeller repeat protein n=1 Tax=Pendulispora brunnea TaxID=2905690 RepID=A0ABZ2KD38_9BACT